MRSGSQHPNPAEIPLMPMYHRAVALAEELGLRNKTVFFNENWVPYAERASYLLEADIGVSAHLSHIETHFAFRTRLLDYIWAGLPMVVTGGDTLADEVAERGLGAVVPIGDVDAFAGALRAVLNEQSPRAARTEAFAAAQHDFAWPAVLQPLIAFCEHPRYAPGRLRAQTARLQEPAPAATAPSVQQRIDALETVVAEKNEHITYLEGLIKQIQAGRVMQLLGRLNRSRS